MDVTVHAEMLVPGFTEAALTTADVSLFLESCEQVEQLARKMLAIVGEETVGRIPLTHELQHIPHFPILGVSLLKLHHALFVNEEAGACLVGFDWVIVLGEGEEGVIETVKL